MNIHMRHPWASRDSLSDGSSTISPQGTDRDRESGTEVAREGDVSAKLRD